MANHKTIARLRDEGRVFGRLTGSEHILCEQDGDTGVLTADQLAELARAKMGPMPTAIKGDPGPSGPPGPPGVPGATGQLSAADIALIASHADRAKASADSVPQIAQQTVATTIDQKIDQRAPDLRQSVLDVLAFSEDAYFPMWGSPGDPNDQFTRAMKVQKGLVIPKGHKGTQYGARAIQAIAEGSGANGPLNASIAEIVSLQKANFAVRGGAEVGEIDGAYYVIKQSGAKSDACGILIDISHFETGFWGILEAATRQYQPTGPNGQWQQIRAMRTQVGCMNDVPGGEFSSMGYMAVVDVGAHTHGFAAFCDNINSPTSYLGHFFQAAKNGRSLFDVTWDGCVSQMAPEGDAHMIHTRVDQDGLYRWYNTSKSTAVMHLSQAGALLVNNLLSNGAVYVGGTPVLSSRIGGFSRFNGPLDSKTVINTDNCTVQQLARFVGGLVNALFNHGLIGE